jgi:AcrR family transcriptional regulator
MQRPTSRALNLTRIEHSDGVLPASQARSRDARDRLLFAGERVFARMGYDRAHVSDIAAAAGCSIGSFYRRFRDKEAFFRALHQRFAERYRENTQKFFAMPQWKSVPSAAVIETFLANTARIMKKNEGFFRALLQRTLDGAGEDYWPALRKGGEQQGKVLASFLRQRGEARLDNQDRESIFILRTVEGALIHRMLKMGPLVDEETAVRALARVVVSHLKLDETAHGAKRKRKPRT